MQMIVSLILLLIGQVDGTLSSFRSSEKASIGADIKNSEEILSLVRDDRIRWPIKNLA